MKYLAIICVLLAFSGCAKPPIAEMDSAKEAVLRAENDDDAVKYAGSFLTRARDALKQMESAAESKRYDAARTHAAEAVTLAEKAVLEGKAGGIRAREAAAAMLSGLRPAIDEADKNIKAAQSANLALDYPQLNRELDGARRDTEGGENDQAMGRHQEALEKGRNARASLGSINQALSNAVTAVSRKK
ncbi:MAG: HEPN domain-containing protein [Treponema sp.]|jgi:HEPN domain-containing protein|nr:HEPN domain-containing protein [Treponema sp.]